MDQHAHMTTLRREKKNRLNQIIWINMFIWLCYDMKKNRLDQIIWI